MANTFECLAFGALCLGLTAGLAQAAPLRFTAALSGANEVPPNASVAIGEALVVISEAQDAVGHRLAIAQITNVTGAHLHCAAVGVNGPVGVTLYQAAEKGLRDGVARPPLPFGRWIGCARIEALGTFGAVLFMPGPPGASAGGSSCKRPSPG